MKTAKELQDNLPNFTGTEHYFKFLMGIRFTDGVKYLAESAECFWLLDIIASYQVHDIVKKEPFQVYKLTVNEDKSGLVEITNGDQRILETQEINYTDFPLQEISIWCIDKICILPSEY
jgi:hypothetical protein